MSNYKRIGSITLPETLINPGKDVSGIYKRKDALEEAQNVSWNDLKGLPFGTIEEEIVLFDDDITLSPYNYTGSYVFPQALNFVAGQEYQLTYGSVTTKFTMPTNLQAAFSIGSMNFTVKPSDIGIDYYENQTGRLTIVKHGVVKKIDAKYLPDQISSCGVIVTINNLPSGMTYSLKKHDAETTLTYDEFETMFLAGKVAYICIENEYGIITKVNRGVSISIHRLGLNGTASMLVAVEYILQRGGNVEHNILTCAKVES